MNQSIRQTRPQSPATRVHVILGAASLAVLAFMGGCASPQTPSTVGGVQSIPLSGELGLARGSLPLDVEVQRRRGEIVVEAVAGLAAPTVTLEGEPGNKPWMAASLLRVNGRPMLRVLTVDDSDTSGILRVRVPALLRCAVQTNGAPVTVKGVSERVDADVGLGATMGHVNIVASSPTTTMSVLASDGDISIVAPAGWSGTLKAQSVESVAKATAPGQWARFTTNSGREIVADLGTGTGATMVASSVRGSVSVRIGE